MNNKKISWKKYDRQGNVILRLKKGKGKEYYNYKLIQFEGEYINGERHNGIGYNIKGEKEFEIKNGFGKGKEYNFNGILVYEGEYANGKRAEK